MGLRERGAAEDQDPVDAGPPVPPALAVAALDMQEPRDAEAILGLEVRAAHERAGEILVEDFGLAEAARGPVAGAVEGGRVDLAVGLRGGRMRDLPLDARAVLVAVLEVVAVGDAVDAEHARGVEVLEPLGHVLDLRAPSGGEAGALDRGCGGRAVGGARLVAGLALRRGPLLALGRVLELRRRLVQVRPRARVDDPRAVVEHLSDRVLRVLERLLEQLARRRQGLAGVEARRRSRLRPADARAAALGGLERRVLRLSRASLRVLLGDHRVGPRLRLGHLLLLLGRQLDRLPAQRADEVAHQSSSSRGGSSASTACPYSGQASLRHSQSCGAPPSSSLAGWPQVGQRGGSALTA